MEEDSLVEDRKDRQENNRSFEIPSLSLHDELNFNME